MLLFALAVAAAPLPDFDASSALTQCTAEKDAYDFDAQAECLGGLIRDYREIGLLVRFARPSLTSAIEGCVAEYSENGQPDWSLIQICVNRQDDLLTETRIPERPIDLNLARTHCDKEHEARPDVSLDTCLRDEVIGYRNFELARATYSHHALQSSFAICVERWTTEGVTDWDMSFYCAQDQLDGYEQLILPRSKNTPGNSDLTRSEPGTADNGSGQIPR